MTVKRELKKKKREKHAFRRREIKREAAERGRNLLHAQAAFRSWSNSKMKGGKKKAHQCLGRQAAAV